MGSDRARVSYDPKQQYRSVVMQQGRVTLEADWNEAGQIASEELRKETLDFVGPCGTPDNGYLVVPRGASAAPTFNQIQFVVVTGGDDLRADSSATAAVLGANGTTLQVIALKSQTQPGWNNNSTHTVTAALTPPQSAAAIGRIVITLTSHNAPFETDDNWNIQSVTVNLSNTGANQLQLLTASGSPLVRLTGTLPSVTLILPAPVASGTFDFTIEPGTMYVGGIRTHLLEAVHYSNQPDWRDCGPEDPYWVSLSSLSGSPPLANEFVYLYLREQEVSAVEDQDLKDIALGGPDTAQRTRLLQRFPRVACQGTNCAAGLAAAQAEWQTEGLYFNSHDMRLKSWGNLQVSFSNQAQNQNPCQPQAQGGYLDPDNQLIRVQIAGFDPLTGNPILVWGFDDASFLYRISVDPANSQNLVFQNVPVDTDHQPVQNQAVEVLRTAANLPNGGDVAATTGFVFTLDSNYVPETQTITMPSGTSLPNEYTSSNQSPPSQLFLRVWQNEIITPPGTAMALGTTGVQVTLTLQSPGNPFHIGDYWLFAVRPAIPQMVYPERYSNAPQPPDGPRLWACPLGVIAWSDEVGTLVADCRNEFCNLVDLSRRQEGCCTITLSPQDITGNRTLQDIIYQASGPTMEVQAANPGADGNNISVQISNLDLTVSPPTFDLTVTETVLYTGLTMGTVEGIVGDDESVPADELAHILTGSVAVNLLPLNQTVKFTGGTTTANAQANLKDSTNTQLLFTMAARTPGVAGNHTSATINVSLLDPTTFDLTVGWANTVQGVTLATLFPSIVSNMSYEIQAFPPCSVAPAFPAEGVTQLSGGVAQNFNTGTAATPASASIFGNPTKICLRPGSYHLPEPLQFGSEQSNITLEACNGATLAVSPRQENLKDFMTGMIQLNGANNVTLSGLTFAMPSVTVVDINLAGLDPSVLGDPTIIDIDASVGLTISGCAGLTVEDCQFSFPGPQPNEVLVAMGILAGADCADMIFTGNVFAGPPAVQQVESLTTGGAADLVFAMGYVQADSLQSIILDPASGAVAGGTLVPSSLDNLVMTGNSFENLAFPVVIITALGAARFETNIMRSCLTGFTILPLIASVASTNAATENEVTSQILSNPTTQRMFSLVVTYPRPVSYVPKRQLQLVTKPPVAPVRPAPVIGRLVPPAVIQIPLPAAAAAPAKAAVGKRAAKAAAPAPAPALKLKTVNGFTTNVAQVMNYFGGSAYLRENFGDLNFSVQFSHNDIDAFVSAGGSLWALAIADLTALIAPGGVASPPTTETTNGMLSLTGNRFRNTWPAVEGVKKGAAPGSFTAFANVQFCAATGNIILNVTKNGGSLIIEILNSNRTNVGWAAVTGNVLMGEPYLPERNPPALPIWRDYNHVVV